MIHGMIHRLIALAAVFAMVAPASAAGDEEAAAYALHLPVTPKPGSSLQRLDIPGRALVASRSDGLADLRVFNAQGKPVPIALAQIPQRGVRGAESLPVMQILGTQDALAVTGVSLRVEDGQRASVVRIDGAPPIAGTGSVLGILLDTRRVADPATALTLEVATPASQPVTFTVESSSDLKAWDPLTDKVIYRTGSQSAAATIAFPPQKVQGRYLRITWKAASRLLSPVTIRSARLETIRGANGARMPRAVLSLPAQADPSTIEFTVPFATPIAALEIVATTDDTVVPIKVLGRDEDEQPWTPIASGSVFRVTREGQVRANAPFDLHGARYRSFRIVADARTTGFATAPRIVARFAPVQVLFLASGPAPFTLATGREAAPAAYLPAADLAQGADVATLPLATTTAGTDPVVRTLAVEQGTPWRRIVLWGVLLAGTALLAGMVWLLTRRRDTPAKP